MLNRQARCPRERTFQRLAALRQQRPLAFFTLLPGMCFLDTVLAQSRVMRSAFVLVRTGRLDGQTQG